jgi:nucleotide-binding universal stress UspA family protein
MYKRILLAYDGTLEGAVALREGALIAQKCQARVFLLSVIPETGGVHMAEALHAGAIAQQTNDYKAVLEHGVARMRQFGFEPTARLVIGEPVRAIGKFAKEVGADLVVVGHRRQSVLERWWSGPTGSFLTDHIRCTLLIARSVISDEAFEAEMHAARASAPAQQSA